MRIFDPPLGLCARSLEPRIHSAPCPKCADHTCRSLTRSNDIPFPCGSYPRSPSHAMIPQVCRSYLPIADPRSNDIPFPCGSYPRSPSHAMIPQVCRSYLPIADPRSNDIPFPCGSYPRTCHANDIPLPLLRIIPASTLPVTGTVIERRGAERLSRVRQPSSIRGIGGAPNDVPACTTARWLVLEF
jgi:hypothetical protein